MLEMKKVKFGMKCVPLTAFSNSNYLYKLQAIYLVLYKQWYKTAKIKKYKHEHYAVA